jgi:general nucleoside transport system permease protein
VINSALDSMAPILLAALGGLLTERAGILNIALEGLMLTGAFTAVVISGLTGNLYLGILGAVAAGVLAGALFSFVAIHLKGNIFITGLAINLLASGLITFLSGLLFSNRGVLRFPEAPLIPRIDLPLVGPVSGAVLPVLLLVPAVWWLLYRTPFGLRVRGAGYAPQVLRSRGVNADWVRIITIMLSGAACGLAGSLLSLRLGAYVPGLSAGRGWIALVAIYLGGKKPAGILIATLFFALADAFAGIAQGAEGISPSLLFALPYFITFLALVAGSAAKDLLPKNRWKSRKSDLSSQGSCADRKT